MRTAGPWWRSRYRDACRTSDGQGEEADNESKVLGFHDFHPLLEAACT